MKHFGDPGNRVSSQITVQILILVCATIQLDTILKLSVPVCGISPINPYRVINNTVSNIVTEHVSNTKLLY